MRFQSHPLGLCCGSPGCQNKGVPHRHCSSPCVEGQVPRTPSRMGCVYVCLAALLISGLFNADASPSHSLVKRDANNSSEVSKDNLDVGKETQPFPQTFNSRLDEADVSNQTILTLDDVVASINQNTAVRLTNLKLLIPADLDLGNIDPDFSRMILNVDSAIQSMEIEGDYTLIVRDFVPIYSQGRIYVKFHGVKVKGKTALALTPAALLALSFDFNYNSQEVIARVLPDSDINLAEEVKLSKDMADGTLAKLLNKEVEEHLNYYVDTQINLALSKISVFTVGRKKNEAISSGPFQQNVQIGELFDEMLADVRKEIADQDEDEIEIPNFHRNFTVKLESNVNGIFIAERGWISGLSEFKRSSNVSLSKTGEFFIMSAMLEFDDLRMGYDKYEASFPASNLSGELDGDFMHRQLTIKVAMHPREDGTCTSTLNELRVFKINGYRIKDITNIGSADWLQVKINNWLIGYFQTKIVKDVEKIMSTAVSNSLSGFDCGEYLPHFKILN